MDDRTRLRISGVFILVVSMTILLLTGTFGKEDNLLGLDLSGFEWVEDVVYVVTALVAFIGGIIILKSLQSDRTV